MGTDMFTTSRRGFLQGGAAGGLLIAIGAPILAQAVANPGAIALAGWVRIAPDGSVTVLSNTSEIGQGTGTAIAQILADELDLDWSVVRIEMAPIEKGFINPGWGEYATYGSGGVSQQFGPLRKAGAQARAMLVGAAASRWQVPPEQCQTESAGVVHRASKRRLGYGALAASASQQPVPEKPALKDKAAWRFIGKDVPRLDLPDKVFGRAGFGVDVQQKGLLVATVMQAPRFGAKLAHVDPKPALAVRGVRKVVLLPNAVAVVADGYWQAKKGLAALQPVWDNTDASRHSSPDYEASLREAVTQGGTVYPPRKSSAEQSLAEHTQAKAGAVRSVAKIYSVPFLHHATMEPMNATARVDAQSAELWLPTQTQTATREAVAKALGFAPEAVTIHTMMSGGGFGRRMEYDFALQAALIARDVGAVVKLIWSREEDMRHDYYRPAAAIKLTADLDTQGMPLAWCFDTACESLLQHSQFGAFKDTAKPVDPSGIGEPPRHYKLGALMYRVSTIDAGVPVGYWRSVAASQNAFAYESFIDELALQAKLGPLEYRQRLLAPDGREWRTLQAVVERSGWLKPAPAGRHRGLAFVHANGSHVAEVVELSVTADGAVKIHAITCAIDCGVAVNPRNVRAQVEGSIVFALSAAFLGEITLKNGAVEQTNFHDYPLVSMDQMPPVDVVILQGGDAPGGVGEEAVGPLAPALANALFAATGKRIRDLPLVKAGFRLV